MVSSLEEALSCCDAFCVEELFVILFASFVVRLDFVFLFAALFFADVLFLLVFFLLFVANAVFLFFESLAFWDDSEALGSAAWSVVLSFDF